MIREKGPIPKGQSLPAVLLKYQQNLLKLMQTSSVVFCEKSRRIGITWGIAADAVLTAAANKSAKGMDVFYIGFNLDMTKEFIETCGDWAKSFSYISTEVEEYVFKDIDEHNNTKDIQAFRIKFDSGFSINALTSRPRSLRGRQGYIIIDEAAFHDDLKDLMKAALAMLIWGGKVLVISTHDGVNNAFNEYIQAIRAKRYKYAILRIDFDDALRDGLYERICLTTGKEWTAESEAEWRAEIVSFYGEGADEELFCVPRQSSGAYLPSLLVESRTKEIPVIRYQQDDAFGLRPEPEREREVLDWCTTTLKPLLDALDKNPNSYLGGDFARSGDLSVLWPVQVMTGLVRTPPFTIELRNIPFRQQLQILWYIIDRLPRFCAAALDARGNGQQMAEETRDRYGADRIHCVMTSAKWYLEAFPPYKASLEDATTILPRDNDVVQDHRAVVVQGGIPQIPEARAKGTDGGKRHGDALVAAVMAHWASLQAIMEYDYTTSAEQKKTSSLRPAESDDKRRFEHSQGAW